MFLKRYKKITMKELYYSINSKINSKFMEHNRKTISLQFRHFTKIILKIKWFKDILNFRSVLIHQMSLNL
jgi:hypothetical protein